MASANDRNRREFERLTMPLTRPLWAVAYRLTGSPDDADDVVQETYLRAYRTFENYRRGSNARAWLFTILYSIVKNRFRASGRRPSESSLTDMAADDGSWAETVSWGSHEELLRSLDRERVSDEIVEAFAQLPAASRMIILLIDVEELGYEEASAILDCPVGTVSSRLYRARRQLYEQLAPLARKKGYLGKET